MASRFGGSAHSSTGLQHERRATFGEGSGIDWSKKQQGHDLLMPLRKSFTTLFIPTYRTTTVPVLDCSPLPTTN